MAITVVGTSTQGNGTGTTFTATLPTGWAAGDVAYLFFGVAGAATPTLAGWTALTGSNLQVSGGGNPRLFFFRRVLQTGDSNPAPSWTGSFNFDYGLVALRGVTTGTPENATTTKNDQTGSNTSNIADTVTTTADNCMLVTAHLTGGGSPTGTPPGSMLEQVDIANNPALQVNTESLGAAGATGTRTETLSGAQTNKCAFTLTVAPLATRSKRALTGVGD